MLEIEITGTLMIAISIALFIIIFAVLGFRIVKQSEVMIIERLGRYNRTLESGINIIWPIIDKPRMIQWRTFSEFEGRKVSTFLQLSRIDLRETVYDFPSQSVITKDNVNVKINALLYFQIMDPTKSVYEIENLPDAIEKLTQTTLRNVIGELELDETLSSRDTINTKLRTILDDATNKWGVKVNRVELQDITPPDDIQQAMNMQMRAERERRAKVLEAEGMKTSAILEAEGIKESQINKAEGEREAEVLKAEGEAKARIKIAEAEAKALKLISEQVKKDPQNYLIALNYINALEKMVSGKDNKTVYIPYEASNILSSIGGIKDLLNQK